MNIGDRFIRYTQFTTTSSEASSSCPSTPEQKDLAAFIVSELHSVGVENAYHDNNGYVYASIPGRGSCADRSIGLIAHMDTSDAVAGPTHAHVIGHFDGKPVTLENGDILNEPDILPNLAGQDLIVTSGDSVLGADDKAGVAEIVTLAERLNAPDCPDHCRVCIAFTPDEEIGRGADRFDLKAFGADYAYTVDGGALGELEYECFNAASCKVIVHGINIHPGSAKNKMKNASLIAMEFDRLLPAWETPAHTEGYEGFHHLCNMTGNEEYAELNYILRDHDSLRLEAIKTQFLAAESYLNSVYGSGTVSLDIRDSYRNMRSIVEQHPHILERAKKAFNSCGVEPVVVPIRGGTDGARLSYEGLPCPNLSTGGYNFHSRFEFITVQAMEKMTDVLFSLVTDGQ